MEEWKQRLKIAREEKGLKKIDFAKLVGVSHPTVTDWEKSVETGGIKEITGVKLLKVCEVLAITPNWLFYGKAKPVESKPKGRDAEEARLLTAFRLTDEVGRDLINSVVDSILEGLENARRHK